MRLAPVFAVAGLALIAGAVVPAEARVVTKNLTLWLKADDGLATDGSSWADRSGHGHDATALSGQAPAYVASGLNGLPVASFSGNQVMAIAGKLLSKQPFTIIAVVTDNSTFSADGDFREILSNWDTTTRTNSIFLGTLWTDATGAVTDRIRFTDAIGGQNQGQAGVGNIKQPTHAFILSATASSKTATVTVNGKVQYNLGMRLTKRDLKQGWYLGDQGDLKGEFWDGAIAEVLVYNSALTAKQLKADVAYLEKKWQ